MDLYLNDRETRLSGAILTSYRSRLKQFVKWCDQKDIENLDNLTGRRLHQSASGTGTTVTLLQLVNRPRSFRVFLRWLESIDAVVPNLHTKVL